MYVGPAVAEEFKRIVRDSEITRYVSLATTPESSADMPREDDANWPKKNVVGRQELEVRIDKDHISFEVSGGELGWYAKLPKCAT